MRIDGPVVVAVDGTQRSARTLRWGVEAAVQRRARLVVAHVAAPAVGPWTWAGAPAVPPDDDALADELRQVCSTVARDHPDLEVTAALLHGSTVPALTEYTRDAQLLVTGRRGSQPATLTVGTALSWRARCPVAIVREDLVTSGPVVVGVDDTPGSWFAAGLAAREAQHRGVPLHVLHVRRTRDDDAGRRTALDVAADLAETYPTLPVRTFLSDGDPVRTLVDASRTAGLVVVGTHQVRGLRRLVGRRVAGLASCPVLVVRDEAP
ncbi:universal stress protein [Cellulomonas palmilytica]|uniref:universal stress protein n=1 Tax=Cellulomonas palmilytica TaxID=2608402 RepID=UPI001F1FCDED|nr:universal stress protein [Cellulomonas palmilytica]UJP39017.1 universal stress protein [Cellulomonas palmilytica]